MSSIENKSGVSMEAYLAYDDSIDGKAEYYDGTVVDWQGASIDHCMINSNLIFLIHSALMDTGFRTHANRLKVSLPATNSIVYPDLFILKHPTEIAPIRPKENDIVCNPVLIVEILAHETAYDDLFTKMNCYFQLGSLREYLVVDQYQPAARIFRLESGNWITTNIAGMDSEIHLHSVNLHIPMSGIYRHVDFDLEE